jgi:hypothetical protein
VWWILSQGKMPIKLAFWNKILNGTQHSTFSKKNFFLRNAEVFKKNLAKENGGFFFEMEFSK